MASLPIRFGMHARVLYAKGFTWLIPLRGKIPLVTDWTNPPTLEQIEGWIIAYPDAGIGLVMDGRFVAIDKLLDDPKVWKAIEALAQFIRDNYGALGTASPGGDSPALKLIKSMDLPFLAPRA